MKGKKQKKRIIKKQRKTKERSKKEIVKDKYFDMLGLFFVILLGIIIYSNSFDCSFHFDDKPTIVDNLEIRDLSDVKSIWKHSKTRFIPYYSLALNYHFGQLNVFGYHLFNLAIHLINACLIFWLTTLVFSSPVLKSNPIIKHKNVFALIAALLFVSHPLATQSVTYIIQRMASMVALFYLLSLLLYVKARLSNKKNIQYILFACSFIAAICAMLSKENSFTLPFAIVLFEIFFLQSKKLTVNFKNYRIILTLVALLGFVLMVGFNFSLNIFEPLSPENQNDFRTISSSNYLFTQFSVIVKYIQLLILPIHQNFDYDFDLSTSFFEVRTILSFLFLLSLIILAIFLFKKNRIISFGIFWFFLTLSIESSIIPISDLIYEHRTYLPSFGFFMILISCIYGLLWDRYKNIALAILVVMIGVNSYLTFERNKIWKDEFSLWDDVVSKSPNKARPYINRGISLTQKNKFGEAILDYTKAIEIRPDFYKPYNNRGNAFKAQKRYKEAIKDFNKAIELNSDYAEPYNNRGSIFMEEKRYNEAIVELNKAIVLKPDFSIAYANRGITNINIGNKETGCMDLEKAIQLGFKPVEEIYNQNCR